MNDTPAYKITTKRADDSGTVTVEKERTLFAIKSPFGISQASIERTGAKWPDAIVLRLHLKGLENFQVTAGKVTLHAAVGGGKVRVWRDGNENAPLDEKSPLWLAIRALTAEGKPTTEAPLRNGYFEVALPKALLEGNPKTLVVSWIDFYRG